MVLPHSRRAQLEARLACAFCILVYMSEIGKVNRFDAELDSNEIREMEKKDFLKATKMSDASKSSNTEDERSSSIRSWTGPRLRDQHDIRFSNR